MTPLTIKVPATAANLGPGFDSIGLALSIALEVSLGPPEATWRVEHLDPDPAGLPADGTNLIVRVAQDVASERGVDLEPRLLMVSSAIPLARGLGSSAAAIVAGIELANELGGLNLSAEERVDTASRIEGHPDNVSAAFYGGFVISVHDGDGTAVVRANLPPADVILCIPGYPLLTKAARAALPATLSHREAVLGSARGNVLVAALLKGDWELAGRMMCRDVFHEPYREPLMPQFRMMRETARRSGAYGAALSGAGPALIAFAPSGQGPVVCRALREAFPDFDVRVTTEDREGTVVQRGDGAP